MNNTLTDRCAVICQTLGLPTVSGAKFVEQARATGNSILTPRPDDQGEKLVVYLISMAYFGRLATPDEAVRIGQLLATEQPASIDISLKKWAACREPAAHNLLMPTDPKVVYIDVSHTLFLKRNTGIQRVVRQLAIAITSSSYRHVFIRFDKWLRGYRPLTDTERSQLLAWEEFSSAKKKVFSSTRQTNGLKQRLKEAGKTWLGLPVKKFIRLLRDLSQKIRRNLTCWLWSQPASKKCLFFWQGYLLMPEVITASERLDVLTTVSATTPLHSTLILYDFLPVTHPEFFTNSTPAGFIQYLKLLRHAEQVSCISNTVQKQLESLLPAIPRPKPHVKVTTHLLAGDFGSLPAATVDEDATPTSLPSVLCVGTIEPRKNQTRVLRAMVAAQDAGQQFRGIFVGNAGWLNGQFRTELQQARSRGIELELHENISDKLLAEFYQNASLTVYCSVAEGFGLPIVESVMAGVPCLASRLGSMREIANQLGGCSLVNPFSTSEIATAITRLLRNHNELAHLTTEARQARWHTWSDYCEQIMDFVSSNTKNYPYPKIPE